MKRLRPLVWVVGLTLLLFAVPSLQADESEHVIVAGAKAGKIVINMEEPAVEKLLGKPSSGEGAMGTIYDTWVSKSHDGKTEETAVVFRFDETGAKRGVCQVAVTSPFFRTQAGVSVESDPTAIWHEFPELRYVGDAVSMDGEHLQMYDAVHQGIAVLIEHIDHPAAGQAWGKCRALIVHRTDNDALTVHLGPPSSTGPPHE